MALALTLVVLFALNTVATARVWGREPEPRRRRLQLAFVWLVPVVGPLLCLVAHARGAAPAPDYERPLRESADAWLLEPPHL